MRNPSINLIRYDNARRALAAAVRVDEAKAIRDKAVAVQAYAKQAKDRSLIEDATEIRLRAERRAGELLRDMHKNQGAMKGKTGRKGKPVLDTTPRLSDLGISKTQSSRWQSLAGLGSREFEIHVTSAKRKATANGFDGRAYLNGREFTGEFERYTPKKYLALVRKVLGDIDLDPASAKSAQRNVKAKRFFTIVEDGLKQEWDGRLFLNPPYHRDLVGQFIEKLVHHYEAGDVKAAILLTNNSSDTEWFNSAIRVCASICFVQGRIRFLLPTGAQMETPPVGQMFMYLGREVDKFERVFCSVGPCVRVTRISMR